MAGESYGVSLSNNNTDDHASDFFFYLTGTLYPSFRCRGLWPEFQACGCRTDPDQPHFYHDWYEFNSLAPTYPDCLQQAMGLRTLRVCYLHTTIWHVHLFLSLLYWIYRKWIFCLSLLSYQSQPKSVRTCMIMKQAVSYYSFPWRIHLFSPQLPRCKKWLKKACVDHFDKMDCGAAISFCSAYMEGPFSASSEFLYRQPPLQFFWKFHCRQEPIWYKPRLWGRYFRYSVLPSHKVRIVCTTQLVSAIH